ncbi:MAG: sigma-70 family RNA polymerase sigma factor [Ardenticatenaceae bacterium]|nr:sigma-70 family RNA polymerase sigma factor [Anaerolineales bacterium]MCB8920392.1 sigma-70 family RNA polymerase sigma factor [Ardenticatenaceae bacterium]MCB8989347.1 sigma-70 family RNA polymerase sigma factor [Ardenticatenaceae bacterium]MCB9004502.1 sigma-70 family RNA polymerase sigma factor [Ardenticatenaceae bacterium]
MRISKTRRSRCSSQQNEKQWLASTYDAYHDPIYRYIYRRIGDVETARELSADVFQRLIQVVCQGKTPPENTRAWLYQTAHNIVIDEYRRRQHRQHLQLDEATLYSKDDPMELVHLHMTADRVRAALKWLTPDQQQVLTLKFLEGFSNQEVAEILDKSIGAVKALQHRGLSSLQQMLEQTTDNYNGFGAETAVTLETAVISNLMEQVR